MNSRQAGRLTILVVEDEPHIAEVVRDYLEQAGYRVIHAQDGRTALAMARHERPALIVLDLMLPGGLDGFDVCREVRTDATLRTTPIIMLTARVDLSDRLVGLELGADDYITKPFSPREVVARVKAVLRRVQAYDAQAAEVLRVADLVMDLRSRRVSVGGSEVSLTPTEFDLLQVLMREPGRVFTRAQLVEAVYDIAYAGYDRAIDSHIKNLRQKIEPDPRNPRYILTVYGVGYRLAQG